MRRLRGFLLANLLLSTVLGCAARTSGSESKLATLAKEETPEKLVLRGRTFASVGDFTRAEQYYVQAMERGAPSLAVFPLLLEACVGDGRYQLAVKYAEEHLAKEPTDVHARFVLGTLYGALGDGEAAETQLRRVVAELPNAADAHFALATVLHDYAHDAVGAATEFVAYLHLEPKGAHAPEARAALMGAAPSRLLIPIGGER